MADSCSQQPVQCISFEVVLVSTLLSPTDIHFGPRCSCTGTLAYSFGLRVSLCLANDMAVGVEGLALGKWLVLKKFLSIPAPRYIFPDMS